ncbi:MAG: lipopolysaccharide assembly protein LapB [Rickettsiella sp.]|nr:lipopolysaccharide assembly protein LapB [Rickettsiella sp.]
MLELLFLLLPFAAASGWYAAYYHINYSSPDKRNDFNREYLLGLNYLLNEQADKAVDTFIKILEVDTETVETHLALGVLFRRRGEIDRAIRLHQNLIARPQLPKPQKIQALLALGQDYYYGGLLDRAERLFFEIANNEENEYSKVALRYLLEIYQQQKRWGIAIEQAKKISKWEPLIFKNIAHYYCELALSQLKANIVTKEIIELLDKALKYDPRCVRANLLKGELAIKAGKWEQAIQNYQAIKKQDPDYIAETLEPLSQCYLQRESGQTELLNYLYATLSEYSKISICLAIVKLIQENDREKALNFLTQQLQASPSLYGLYHLVDLHCRESHFSHTNNDNEGENNLAILKTLIAKLMKNKPVYRCSRCGFNSKILDWFCPACRNWSTIKPDRL